MTNLFNWIDERKLKYKHLSKNPNAIELLKANKDKIDWDVFSRNPNIYICNI